MRPIHLGRFAAARCLPFKVERVERASPVAGGVLHFLWVIHRKTIGKPWENGDLTKKNGDLIWLVVTGTMEF